jgi:two-component system cell cycle response regulator
MMSATEQDGLWEAVRALTADAHNLAQQGQSPLSVAVLLRELAQRAETLARHLEAPAEPVADGEAPARARPVLLLVEDDPHQAAVLSEALHHAFEVVLAVDGCEAEARLREEAPPDVILTDLYMPRASGFSLLALTGCSEETSQIPLLVMSGSASTDAKVAAFEAGAYDFITKPISCDELVARIRTALARTQRLRHERQLQGIDDLTGLANRRGFRTFLEAAVRRAHREGDSLSVVMIDQDGLKALNDRYGHHVGDEGLRTLGRALARSVRASDCAARLGGDEFAVVMPGCDREGAERLVERVKAALLAAPVSVEPGVEVVIRVSGGVASLDEVPEREWPDRLLQRADRELYAHKPGRPGPPPQASLARRQCQ